MKHVETTSHRCIANLRNPSKNMLGAPLEVVPQWTLCRFRCVPRHGAVDPEGHRCPVWGPRRGVSTGTPRGLAGELPSEQKVAGAQMAAASQLSSSFFIFIIIIIIISCDENVSPQKKTKHLQTKHVFDFFGMRQAAEINQSNQRHEYRKPSWES